ncbi:hypothetical protein PF010_g8960 [Phytophthora fragariae]|uniref:Protein ZIP4 homolog n=1 Tax=Phytophthora fragariae TaxID=53985 RepID=A0A6G0LDH6_9STRA|nr:hypothetical protein PF010_g8960 [Phytophthora fragariae]
MQEDGASAVLKLVEAATKVLARADEASWSSSAADTAALNQVLAELQRLTAELGSQRVLELSGVQLMNAGVELYNAPRAGLRILVQMEKSKLQGEQQPESFPRYSLAVTRFVAAKIMGLSLACSKDGDIQGGRGKNNTLFVDECVDVLRSFGRVGMLMLESASIDCEKCEEYLGLAKEAFSSSLQLWSQIGLSCLTKFKRGLELEDVVDDLWDFCVDRVRVHQLLGERSNNAGDLQDIVSSLQELKMLVPYKASYASSLLGLMRDVSDGYDRATQHELQVTFAEEAIRIGDALETSGDGSFSDLVISFKQHILVNMLRALCTLGDLERADTCYQLIPANRDTEVLLLMYSLYDSLVGARIYAQGFSYSGKGNRIYQVLTNNYEDADFVINLEMACNFASLEDKRCEAMDELKRLGPALLAMEREEQAIDSRYIRRVRQSIFDALQYALNANQHEVCFKCADAGIAVSSTAQDKAMYMRMISRSCIHLERYPEASVWAEKAYDAEPSKQSLFTVFQVELDVKPQSSDDKLLQIINQLRARDDFEIEDLLAIGKLASDSGPKRQDIVLQVLDELCGMVQCTDCPANLPVSVLLQNAAQLSLNKFTQDQGGANRDASSSYGEKFMTYASVLLQQLKPKTGKQSDCAGPSSVFEWFFRMSFDIARSTEDSKYFVVAADIAERSDELYKDQSPLKHRCKQCLLAAVSSDMMKIDRLDKSQLMQLLHVIERYESIATEDTHAAGDVSLYLAKAVIAVKLRLLDANTKAILNICKTSLHSVPEIMEIGELVLYVSKFNEASEVRDSYRLLASEIFNYGLQMLVQAGSIDTSKLCCLLRRLIMLADSKAKAHECFEQLFQFINSVNMPFSDLDMEWFVAKAWNTGVICQRSNDIDGALKFMKIAQAIMQHSASLVAKLGDSLDEQYQALLRMSAK